MWSVVAQNLSMAEGDYGLALPIEISGATFAAADEIKITFKTRLNGETIIEKTYGNIQNNTVNLEFTKAESDLLPVGSYVYSMDWYQNGAFMCNVIQCSAFMVVEKA